MNFSTKVPVQKSNFPINYSSKIVLLGSCFTENMGEKFKYFKFQTMINPFGIIFNPVSVAKIIERSIQKKYFTEKDVFFHNELWHSFDVHSECSNPDKKAFLFAVNKIIDEVHDQLICTTHLFITLGTSWVYSDKISKKVVANCHKVPQNQFDKELLSVNSIHKAIQNILDLIGRVNPNCAVVFTVSPVRHLKDGFVENQLSKAQLITALHSVLANSKPKSHYFPSYEIMMDELRDYRYYTEDMLHPTQVAIDYIWEKFSEVTISESALKIMEDVQTVQRGLSHRPFNSDTKAHNDFLNSLQLKIAQLEALPFGIVFQD
jgi:hypothetical protein